MLTRIMSHTWLAVLAAGWLAGGSLVSAQETFDEVVKRTQKEKGSLCRPAPEASRRTVRPQRPPRRRKNGPRQARSQEGVRVRLPEGVTWDKLAGMTPEEIRKGNHWPAGFYPLPHPHHEAGDALPRSSRSRRSRSRTPAT